MRCCRNPVSVNVFLNSLHCRSPPVRRSVCEWLPDHRIQNSDLLDKQGGLTASYNEKLHFDKALADQKLHQNHDT